MISMSQPLIIVACVGWLMLPLFELGPTKLYGQERSGAIDQFQNEAARLRKSTKSGLGNQYLDATAFLPAGEKRVVFRDPNTKRFYSEQAVQEFDEPNRSQMKKREVGAGQFYTKYGTPMAYARPIDLLVNAELKTLDGRRILDFGYGGIGHLRLLAIMGATTTGVDVDSYLTALYSHVEDHGPFHLNGKRRGSVQLVHGRWPAESQTKETVGKSYDLFIAKNVLKRGYIHPERKAEDRFLIQLGVDDNTYCRAMYDALNPGGVVMIYNIYPAQNPAGKRYLPWADGRCPFDKQLLERVGFEVVSYNVDDNKAVRTMGLALGWDNGSGNLADTFAQYTLLRRPQNSSRRSSLN